MMNTSISMPLLTWLTNTSYRHASSAAVYGHNTGQHLPYVPWKYLPMQSRCVKPFLVLLQNDYPFFDESVYYHYYYYYHHHHRRRHLARKVQSIQRLATGWVVWEANPGAARFSAPCFPLNLLYDGYRVCFPAVKWRGLGVEQTLPSGAEVKEKLYFYSSSGTSCPVLGRNLPIYCCFYCGVPNYVNNLSNENL
jgi:hypothetical protein